jgi:hypothetical protein
VLEQCYVASHKGRGSKAEDLPEREIPRHNSKQRSERLVANKSVGTFNLHHLVRHLPLGLLGVVTASPRAFRCFFESGLDGLAHLLGHELGDSVLLRFE